MAIISRRKSNQTMNFGQLIEYKRGKTFYKNHTQNELEKLFRDPFLKNQNWAYYWINSLSFIHFVFIIWQVEGYLKILKLSCRPLAFTSKKPFLKTRRVLGLVSLRHFLHDFWRKIFLLSYSINWPNFIVWFPLLQEIIDNMSIAIVF